MTPQLSQFRRIVVKVGSALLVKGGAVNDAWLATLVDDIARLAQRGTETLVVSSGAIALGRGSLGLPRGRLKLEESQAAAAIGQIALAHAWRDALARHDLKAGQILLTLGDTEERRRYLNGRATIGKLLELGAVPVINENDTVATSEIRYGDNDRLAARVATMTSADCLILLSDIDGLYTAPPHLDPAATHVPLVASVTPQIEAMAGAAASELSRGGMRTKIEAAKIATSGSVAMLIALGKRDHPLAAVEEGARCTWFLATGSPIAARKRWIAGSLEPKGVLHVDAGARRALLSGNSLLPAGVKRVEGLFSRGEAVLVRGPDQREIGRGLVGYDHSEAARIAGRKSREIEALLGYPGRAAMVHRDDLAISPAEAEADIGTAAE